MAAPRSLCRTPDSPSSSCRRACVFPRTQSPRDGLFREILGYISIDIEPLE